MNVYMNGIQICKMTELERFLKLNYKVISKNNIFNIYNNNKILFITGFDKYDNTFLVNFGPTNYNYGYKSVKIIAENKENGLLQVRFLAKKLNENMNALTVRKCSSNYKLIKVKCKYFYNIIFEGYINIDTLYVLLKDKSEEKQIKILNSLNKLNQNNSKNLNFISFLRKK